VTATLLFETRSGVRVEEDGHYRAQLAELLAVYEERYIAIHNGQVINTLWRFCNKRTQRTVSPIRNIMNDKL
jgi:hypothetical protein